MVAKGGHRLLDEAAITAMRDELMPLANLVTPNLPEAAALMDMPTATNWAEMEATAARFTGGAVLLKGGHLTGTVSPDLLSIDGVMTRLEATRIETANTHGTGCTLSAAIAALLPQHGEMQSAVRAAKNYVTSAIAASGQLDVGHGHGPVHHFHQLWQPRGASIL
jgi:hydroxymethylpyrimidine/phosphomethylpyrimidine kinase